MEEDASAYGCLPITTWISLLLGFRIWNVMGTNKCSVASTCSHRRLFTVLPTAPSLGPRRKRSGGEVLYHQSL